MPFVIITFQGKELDRRELLRPMTIGRAADCDLVLDDHKLSRHHCRIEPEGDSWAVVDLQSRNGTLINGQRIERHVLSDGETITAPSLQITYHTGPFVPAESPAPQQNKQR